MNLDMPCRAVALTAQVPLMFNWPVLALIGPCWPVLAVVGAAHSSGGDVALIGLHWLLQACWLLWALERGCTFASEWW